MRKRKMTMKKSNILLVAIISITTISLGVVSTLFVNNYNAASTTTPVVENNIFEAPGFEEDEELDENMKSYSTDKIQSENPTTQLSVKQSKQKYNLIKAETATIQSEEFMLGDVDGNGEISIADATQVQKIIAYLIEPTDEMTLAADVNADNMVNILDATMIQMYCGGIIGSFVSSEPSTEPTNDPSDLPPKAPVQDGEWGISVKN